MDTYELLGADERLGMLIERAAKGEPFVIAREGQPLVKVVPVENAPPSGGRPIGFLKGAVLVPDDFDRMFEGEIISLFEGKE